MFTWWMNECDAVCVLLLWGFRVKYFIVFKNNLEAKPAPVKEVFIFNLTFTLFSWAHENPVQVAVDIQ